MSVAKKRGKRFNKNRKFFFYDFLAMGLEAMVKRGRRGKGISYFILDLGGHQLQFLASTVKGSSSFKERKEGEKGSLLDDGVPWREGFSFYKGVLSVRYMF